MGGAPYLNTGYEERETALDKCGTHQRADGRHMGGILVQARADPGNFVRPPARLLRCHARGNHGDRWHGRMRPVQNDQAHVVCHPDTRDAVRPVGEGGAERSHLGRHNVRT